MFWRKSGLGHEPKLASSADHSASGAPCRSAFTAHQLHRMLGVTYKTAWFLAHRIRESMGDTSHKSTGGLGGANKVVESGRNLRRRQSQEPRVQRTGPEESRRLACRARRTCRFVLCRQRHGKERAPFDRHEREPHFNAHDRRQRDLSEDRRRIREPSFGQSLGERICAP